MTNQLPNAEQNLNRVLQTFYRDPNTDAAVNALAYALELPNFQDSSIAFGFMRIAAKFPEVKAEFETLAKGSDHAEIIHSLLTANSEAVTASLYEEPITHPEELDFLWAEFGITGDPKAVYKIIGVLDYQDRARVLLQDWLDQAKGKVQFQRTEKGFSVKQAAPLLAKGTEISVNDVVGLFVRCGFPIDYEQLHVQGPLDIDIQVAIKAKNGELKFDELPFELPGDVTLLLAIKHAAVWSLRSCSSWNERVAEICAAESQKPGGAARSLIAP